MSTTLKYNGVQIKNCTLKDFRQKLEYDPSGTDPELNRFRIRVNGYVYLHSSATAAINVNEDGAAVPKPQVTVPRGQTSAVGIFKLARKLLMEPRRDLELLFNGQSVLVAQPTTSPGDVKNGIGDVDNGPKPMSCEIVKVVGKKSIRIEFEIECALVECDSNRNTRGVLSNRWGQTDDYDENFYTTRTTTGRLRIASQYLGAMGPHSFRSWVMPPLSKGFRRHSMNFVATPDQLVLEYQIVDRQIDAAPPAPGVTWSGTHSMSTADQLRILEEVNLTIHGPPGQPDKKPLISIAADVAMDKLDILSKQNGEEFILEQASIVDHIDTAQVEVRIQIARVPKDPMALLNFDTTKLGLWPSPVNQGAYDRLKSAIPTAFGVNSPGGILVSHLQTQCDNAHAMPAQGEKDPSEKKKAKIEATTIATYEGSKGTLTTSSLQARSYSSAHRKFPYTHYEMSASYLTSMNRIQLPIARSNNDREKDSAAIVTLSPATSKLIVEVQAERAGKWPDIPDSLDMSDETGNRYWLLKSKVTPETPRLGVNAQRDQTVFAVKCHYEYGTTRRATKIEAGQQPAFAKNLFSHTVPASAFLTDIFDLRSGASLTRR